jgi:hypothetical protein
VVTGTVLGAAVLIASVAALIPAAAAVQGSVVYLAATSAGTLSTAHQLVKTAPATPASHVNVTGRATGWFELRSNGATQAARPASSAPAPSGGGYLLSDASLDARTVNAGLWAPTITLRGKGAPKVIPVVRVFKRSSDGLRYSLIATTAAPVLRLGTSKVTVTPPAVEAPSVTFAPGDRLYMDMVVKVVTAASSSGGGVIHLDNGGAGQQLRFPVLAAVVDPTPNSTAGTTPVLTPTPTATATATPTATAAPTATAIPTSTDLVWQPRPGTTWQWQITGAVDPGLPVQMYDIDLFDAQPVASSYVVPGFGTVNVPRGENAGVIERLHAAGKVVVCYLDTGAWENYRPDAALFPVAARGNSTGWSGERWLDIRASSWSMFEPLMSARLDLAARSGCDGVEPDQNNPIGNSPGFPITLQDQKTWYLHVAQLAHDRNLSVGQKNGIETTDADTVAAFDWNLNEECRTYDECAALRAFVQAGKAVFQVEYVDEGMTAPAFCPADNADNFDGLLKELELGAWRLPCR